VLPAGRVEGIGKRRILPTNPLSTHPLPQLRSVRRVRRG
jgi:hypothetical protein